MPKITNWSRVEEKESDSKFGKKRVWEHDSLPMEVYIFRNEGIEGRLKYSIHLDQDTPIISHRETGGESLGISGSTLDEARKKAVEWMKDHSGVK